MIGWRSDGSVTVRDSFVRARMRRAPVYNARRGWIRRIARYGYAQRIDFTVDQWICARRDRALVRMRFARRYACADSLFRRASCGCRTHSAGARLRGCVRDCMRAQRCAVARVVCVDCMQLIRAHARVRPDTRARARACQFDGITVCGVQTVAARACARDARAHTQRACASPRACGYVGTVDMRLRRYDTRMRGVAHARGHASRMRVWRPSPGCG